MAKTLVCVTDKYIESVSRQNATGCPFAQKLAELVDEAWQPNVYTSAVKFYGPELGDCLEIEQPDRMRDWISNYDHFIPVKPIRVTLEIPDRILRKKDAR